jgi:hypothetical protein
MPEREFSSPDGRRWRVWEVHPRDVVGERRRDVERRVTPVESLVDPPVLERRQVADRRSGPGRSRATLLPAPWHDGWIVFEQQPEGTRSSDAVVETRRLAPIPDAWTTCSERELATLLAQAAAHRPHAPAS